MKNLKLEKKYKSVGIKIKIKKETIDGYICELYIDNKILGSDIVLKNEKNKDTKIIARVICSIIWYSRKNFISKKEYLTKINCNKKLKLIKKIKTNYYLKKEIKKHTKKYFMQKK